MFFETSMNPDSALEHSALDFRVIALDTAALSCSDA